MHNPSEYIANLKISLAGFILYWFFPYRHKIALHNIGYVYGDQLNPAEKKKLIKAFYSHLATSIKEAFLLRFMSERQLRSRVDVKGAEYMLDIVAHNRGALVVTGHFGNWEFAPLGGILNFKAYKGQFHFIRRTLGNKLLERILFKRYYNAGLHVIAKKNSLYQVSDALDNNHVVIFVLDQHAAVSNKDGIAVEFFGKKAGTYRSLATFSRHTEVPVVPAASYRLPNGKHVLEFYEPIPWEECENTPKSLYTNTLKYNQALEKIILAHPEQWMWIHKRWKLNEIT